MNARTSILPDFIVSNQELFDILDITDDLEIAENMFSYLSLSEKKIPLDRANEDKGRINKYGAKLPELCKRCNLFIANGRIFNDQGIGKTTCKNVSLVDYLLLTPNLFDVISD